LDHAQLHKTQFYITITHI